MTKLFQRSKEIILKNQHSSGAYVASPNFPTYQYSWFRDSAFIAYAMNLVGEHKSARRFHQWATDNILARADTIERAVLKTKQGFQLDNQDYLHTRYALDGTISDEDWPNFQLDGFGTWLWALSEHLHLSGQEASPSMIKAVDMLRQYLASLWQLPCYDCWEEFPDKIHTHTLAALFAGLKVTIPGAKNNYQETISEIHSFVLERAVTNHHLVKFIDSDDIDASLLGVSVPYNLISPTDPIMVATVEKIEEKLNRKGGLHRYTADTYYGGGEWILLTAWLGWYYSSVGNYEKARQSLEWVESKAGEDLQLPEQLPSSLNDPSHYQPWVDQWGNIAKPLLWSHAKYIILYKSLDK
ncbi:MAG: glycoside hydrolase family 15 protein [Anaerolineaceae bacterium]|nr:glycoside hydrolase family 15 protein [Anaerolineaceae bacterium]